MIKNLFFLQALLLSSIHTVAADKPPIGIRGATVTGAAANGERSLKKGMGAKTRSSNYDDSEALGNDYYYAYGEEQGSEYPYAPKEYGYGYGRPVPKGPSGKKSKKSKKGPSRDYAETEVLTPAPVSNCKKGEKGRYPGLYPKVGEINFLDDNFFDDCFFSDDDCELVVLNETFTVPRASRYLAPDTSPQNLGDPTLISTVFIWENQQIYEPDGDVPIVGTRISGTCTRTTQGGEGMGTCQLVFVDDDDYTINVEGVLSGPFGSSLAITGGTGGMVGVIGEMDFFPIYNLNEFDGDVFINVTRYEVEADLGLIVCPSY